MPKADLNVKGLVRNRHLSKSISDAGWSIFRHWLEYFGYKYGKATVAVPPHNTSQNCSNCGEKVKKSLSTRTHICPHCNYVEDRDINAAKNILQLGLTTVGHTGSHTLGSQCGLGRQCGLGVSPSGARTRGLAVSVESAKCGLGVSPSGATLQESEVRKRATAVVSPSGATGVERFPLAGLEISCSVTEP